MVKKSNFTSKNNSYLIWAIDNVLKILFTLFHFVGLPRIKKGTKNRVIFLEFAHLGDALMLTPAIRFAKQEKKDFEIICFASSSGAKAFVNNPFVSQVKIIDLPWYEGRRKFSSRIIKQFLLLVKEIKKSDVETITNFRSTSYHYEHLAMWLAGVPHRIGFAHKGFGYLLTQEIKFKSNTLIAQQKLNVINNFWGMGENNFSLKPNYFIKDQAIESGSAIYNKLNLNKSKKKIGINISAQHNFLWPEEHWIELLKLLNGLNVELVFLGPNNFIHIYEIISNQLTFNIHSLVGETTLDELAVILTKLDLLITIDTGIRHLANALAVPIIVLRNGANSIEEFGQYVVTEEVIFNKVSCSPCGRNICPLGTLECMTGITHELVFAQAKEMLNEK